MMMMMIPVMMMSQTKFMKNKFYFLIFLQIKIGSQTSKVVSMSVKAAMDKKIAETPVFVISKSYCPFCVKAKKVLKKYNIPADKIEIMEIENDADCNEIQDYMKQITGGRSVPRVFIGGKCIGGGDETAAADSSGKLQGLLQSAGAV